MMKRLIVIGLSLVFLALLGCSDENPYPTNTTGDRIELAKKGPKNPKPPKGDPKDCTECDENKNIVCTSSKTLSNGAVVTWTSSFGGFDYAKGTDYAATVTWSVANGTASFTSFTAKKKKTWTPKRVDGDWNYDAGSLTVSMDPMHHSIEQEWQGYIGNGHFKLELNVTNANGSVRAKLGVNVHLEDPDGSNDDRCP